MDRRKSALKVVSHVPRNAPGNQTQERNRTLPPDAGKTCFPGWQRVAEGVWPGPRNDTWDSKASRWMEEGGAGLVRAGLLAWREAEKGFSEKRPDPRRVGVIGLVASPVWPDWLRGKSAQEIAGSWKEHPPLWLLGCLPNLPVAQLAIEVGARGPVETIRYKPTAQIEGTERMAGWLAGQVEVVIWVEQGEGQALASVWKREKQ